MLVLDDPFGDGFQDGDLELMSWDVVYGPWWMHGQCTEIGKELCVIGLSVWSLSIVQYG